MGAVELMCVGRLLRMGGESLLLPGWRSVGGGFTSKGELDACVIRAVPEGQETSVGWEQDGLGWVVVLPMVSVQSTCWMDAV